MAKIDRDWEDDTDEQNDIVCSSSSCSMLLHTKAKALFDDRLQKELEFLCYYGERLANIFHLIQQQIFNFDRGILYYQEIVRAPSHQMKDVMHRFRQ